MFQAWKAKAKTKFEERVPNPELRKLYLKGGKVIGCLAAFILIVAIYRQVSWWREAHLRAEELKAGPRVRTVAVKATSGMHTIVLSGETRPYATVTLYAKVSGYLSDVKVDKGDLVKANQVLAIINSPETSKEYSGALADAQNKRGIASRMKELKERNLISTQEADQAISDAGVSEAKLEQVAVYKGYELLRAPFDGTVTARFVDPGTLVQNAANSQTSSQPVVTVSQVDRLRVYVYVDQKYAYFVEKGAHAVISAAERPELKIDATVTRVAGELDPRTRMMLVEIELDNAKHDLVAGSLVQVALDVKLPVYMQVPVEAVVIRASKSYVPIVDADDTIHYREVTTGDNDGTVVSILSGLKEGELVALDIGNSLSESSHVRAIRNIAGKEGG